MFKINALILSQVDVFLGEEWLFLLQSIWVNELILK